MPLDPHRGRSTADERSPPAADLLLTFARGEVSGGALLIATAVVALLWSNSPWAASYAGLLHAPLGVAAATWRFVRPSHFWVDDGLMALFFLVVALEIRREATEGRLASPALIAAPGLAALGGMVVPASIYVAINAGDPAGLRGWATPVATDIAFSLAVLQAAGPRVPTELRLFLTALAIIDDLGAILVIAVFYAGALHPLALAASAALWLGMLALNRAGVARLWVYACGGLLLWVAVLRSGLHPTLAGVALALAVPRGTGAWEEGVAGRLEHAVGALVARVVLPLFGLLNAGLPLAEIRLSTALGPVPLGVLAGLLVGKPLGVFGASWLGARLGLVRLPEAIGTRLLFGGAVLCGIGFTMSLFIADLAFAPGSGAVRAARLATLAASVLAAGAGLLVLRRRSDTA